jgi:hypothetical protein
MMNAPRRFRFLNQDEFNALSSQERVDYLREALAPASGLGESATATLEPAVEARPTRTPLTAASLRAVAKTLRARTRRTQVNSPATLSELRRPLARSRRLVEREPRD